MNSYAPLNAPEAAKRPVATGRPGLAETLSPANSVRLGLTDPIVDLDSRPLMAQRAFCRSVDGAVFSET
jgi:hypothetical protein